MEANETFGVNLSGATNGATISDGQGVGTIINDDAAPVAGSVSINDVTITEGNNGTQVATFTVTRSGGTAAFDVNYATADGTATTADGDYVATSGTPALRRQRQHARPSRWRSTATPRWRRTRPSGSICRVPPTVPRSADGHGVGTIINDDVAVVDTPATVTGLNVTGDKGRALQHPPVQARDAEATRLPNTPSGTPVRAADISS